MKKLFFILLSLSIAAGLFAVISGSAHDFSDESASFYSDAWNTPGTKTAANNELCEPCHTPHNGTLGLDAPLWNHTQAAGASFTNYGAGFDMDATVGDPAGISLLCLSCHDGATALDSFGGTVGVTPLPNTEGGYVGTDLSNDHPISFTYDAALVAVDTELHDPTATASGLGGNIDADMLSGAGNDQLECSSCHDVHNTASIAFLLRKSNAGSALCLTCHDK